MPTIISQDANSITYVLDDGRQLTVPRAQAERLGLSEPPQAEELVLRPLEIDVPNWSKSPNLRETLGARRPEERLELPIGMVPPVGTIPAGTIPPVPDMPRLASRTHTDFGAAGAAGWGGEVRPEMGGVPGEIDIPALPSTLPGSVSVRVARSRPGEAPPTPPDDTRPQGAPGMLGAGRGMVGEGAQQQAEAIREAAEIETAGLDAIAAAKQAQNQYILDKERELAAVEDKNQAERERRAARIDAAIQKSLDAKLERGRFWASRSTASKITAGLGVILGGIGQALGGTDRNMALDLINKAIDDDVQMQLAEIDKLGADVALLEKGLAGWENIAKGREAKYNALMARGTAATMRDIDIIKDQTQSALVKTNADMAIGDLTQKYGDYLAKAGEADRTWDLQERQFTEQKRHSRRMEGIAAMEAARQRDEFEWRQAQAARAEEINRQQAAIYNPVTEAVLPSRWAGDAKMVRESQQKITSYVQASDKLREYRDRLREVGRVYKGPGSDNPKIRDMIRDQATREAEMMLKEISRDWLKTKEQGGRFSKEDVQQAEEALGGGVRGLLQQSDPAEAMQSLITRMDRAAVNDIASEVLVPMAEVEKYIYDTVDAQDKASLERARLRTAEMTRAAPAEASYRAIGEYETRAEAPPSILERELGVLPLGGGGALERKVARLEAEKKIGELTLKAGRGDEDALRLLKSLRKSRTPAGEYARSGRWE